MMLVPRTRLLVLAALIALPLTLLGAIAPNVAIFSSIPILGLILAAVLDLVLGYNSLNGITVELPEIVRLSKDREGVIDLKITCHRKTKTRLRLGLPFPYEITSSQEDVIAVLPEEGHLSHLAWQCTAEKRGVYRLNACYLELASPLGFWAMRGAVPTQCEIRVYPNLSHERQHLAALFLNRGGFGIHPRRQIGKGREFEKLREYIPGDSYNEIHWKATAKRRHPVTKVFQIERTQEVYVIIDASRLSARPSQTFDGANRSKDLESPVESVLERFVTAALVMGLAAQKQGDLFGLLIFNDQIRNFVRASAGKAHYSACRDALYTLQPKSVNPDFDELATFLRLRIRRRALLMILTSLDDPLLAESFVKNMGLICRQHLVLVNMLKPALARPIFSDPDVSSVQEIYRELGGHSLWHNLRELERTLHHHGMYFSLVENERLCVDAVSQYVNVKQRQLL